MSQENAIVVKHVYKRFKLPHEKVSSIKSLFTQHRRRVKGYEVQHALDDINFEIKPGEFFGIVGRNGSGKSTLLKILAGIYQPTKGNVAINGKLVPFIELGVGFNAELTGRENVYLNGALLGFSRDEIDAMYDDIVAFAELERFMDQKLKNYSSGMQVRLAFSVATRAHADILLVDEVLAVGDADFQRKCFKYFKQLKKEKKTVVFVSHDMNAVREYCDRAILIEKSKIIREGKVSDVASSYTKLFIEDDSVALNATEQRLGKKRWGDGEVRYSSVKILPSPVDEETKSITIKAEYTAAKTHESLVMGFVIKNPAGTEMCGTNTKLLHCDTGKILSGQTKRIIWNLPNVLNEGEYTVDIAISNRDESMQYDWWEDAATFSVYREQHTHYAIEPNISVSSKS